jgi:4-hydroxybenzoate polyprenyltransferase
MSTWTAKLRDYAELTRVSNLPTVLPNVLVGAAIGAEGGSLSWVRVVPCALAVSFFYLAGMALNDAADVEVDRVERPERPIPSGRIALTAARRMVAVAFLLGLALLAPLGVVAFGLGVVLVVVIVAYDLLHRRHAWTVLLMGAARGMIYPLAAAAVAWPFHVGKALWFAITVLIYTTAFTIVARAENREQLDARRWLAAGIPMLVLIPSVWILPGTALAAGAAAIPLVLWQLRAVRAVFASPPETKQAVLTWISGFGLLDFFYLNVLGRPLLSVGALACFALTLVLQRRIMGT